MAIDLELATTRQIFEELKRRHETVLLCVAHEEESEKTDSTAYQILWKSSMAAIGLCETAKRIINEEDLFPVKRVSESN